MPRSNKKKFPLKPPNDDQILKSKQFKEMQQHNKQQEIYQKHESFISEDDDIATLMKNEKTLMISRTIFSGKKHGINLEHGSSNPGTGDCAFESVILNINDRSSFAEKFLMPVNYYRRIWVTDMANRTVDGPWNIYSAQQWMEGWRDMLTPGTYERGIFGDLMLPGIACGVKKYLLIFNTNLETPHDPIYIVDPRTFGVNPDNEVPVVLSYNLSHYESIHPLKQTDIQATVNLVKDYMGGMYRFSRKDLPYLLGLENETNSSQISALSEGTNGFDEKLYSKDDWPDLLPPKKQTIRDETNLIPNSMKIQSFSKKDISSKETINLDEIDEFLDREIELENKKQNHQSKRQKRQSNEEKTEEIPSKKAMKGKENIEAMTSVKKAGQVRKTNKNGSKNLEDCKLPTLCYRSKNEIRESPIKAVNGKMECPFCKLLTKNVHLHLKKMTGCSYNIDMDHFDENFKDYKKQIDRIKNVIKQRTFNMRQKEVNPESVKLAKHINNKNFRNKKKAVNLEQFKLDNKEAVMKTRKKKKETNLRDFNLANKISVEKTSKKRNRLT